MKSDAPKGEDLEADRDMEPSEEEDSEYDQNYDPMGGRNRWAEPHGPSTLPGQKNGYAAHIDRQRQLEAELDRQIEAQLQEELRAELAATGPGASYRGNARMNGRQYGEPMGLGGRYGEPMGLGGMGGMGMHGMGTMPSTMDAHARYGEQTLPVDMNDIKLKENGEVDIDNMNEQQLYAHMLRLQEALVAHGGNPDDLGDSSEYSESQNGGPPQQIQQNRGGVVLGSSEQEQQARQKMGLDPATMQQNELQKMGQIQKNNHRERQQLQQQQQQQQQQDSDDNQVQEGPDSERQLRNKKAMEMMNGNFSIPIPKNPDEELGWRFDTFTVSLSVMLFCYIAAIGLLIYFVLQTVDNSVDFGVGQRSIPGKVFNFIHQECRGQGVSMQPYIGQAQLNLPGMELSEVKFGPCNHVYAKKQSDQLWYMWSDSDQSWKALSYSPQKAQRVDPQGNLWFFDNTGTSTKFGFYNATADAVKQIRLQSSSISPSTLDQLTFRDGYIFALSSSGLCVWDGTLVSGQFNTVENDKAYSYIQAASPTQMQDFVSFYEVAGLLEISMINIEKNEEKAINTVTRSDIQGIARPVFSNDLDQTFLQTRNKLYQIMTNTKDRVETITYSLTNGPLDSPAVNINGDVYYKDGTQWIKKTFKFQAEASFESIQTTKTYGGDNQVAEEPERRNLYIIGIIILIILFGVGIGYLYSKYKEQKDGPKDVDPKDQPCRQDIVHNDSDNYMP